MGRRPNWTLMFAVIVCAALRAGGQIILEPQNKEVALAGRLREVHEYGPPGYGENKKVDTPITYWLLQLPNSVNTVCTPEKPQWEADDCKATKRLKLFFPTLPANNGLERKATAMRGRQVLATGVLHRSDTVGEITPIYMNVTELQPVQAAPNP